MKSIQNDIQDLVLGFFDTIGSRISSSGEGVYVITIPEKYMNHFLIEEISIAFDREVSSKHDCELVIPGSRILSLVIDMCAGKGPVALRNLAGNGKDVIRYHFFIHFSGLSSMSALDHVDVTLDPPASKISGTAIGQTSRPLGWPDPKSVTPTYSLALDELQKRYDGTKIAFLENANRGFAEDIEMFVKNHDTHVRQLDDAIRRKEKSSDDFARVQEFRFDTVEKIKNMEKEKLQFLDTLQRKHRITLEYKLVACEVLTSRPR